MELVDILNRYTKKSLLSMGRYLGLSQFPSDRTNLIASIAQAMQDPAAVSFAVSELSSAERALLEFVQLHRGRMSKLALQALAFREQISRSTVDEAHWEIEPLSGSAVFEVQLAVLASRGLLLTVSKNRDSLLHYEFKEQVLIPEPVLAHLPEPALVKPVITSTPPPPHIRYSDPSTFQRDLYLYWSFIRDNSVGLTTRGLVKKPLLKKINQTLLEKENIDDIRDESETQRLRFLRQCLLINQLIEIRDNQLFTAPQSDLFFSKPLVERARIVLDGYARNSFWNELLQIPCLVIEGSRVNGNIAPPLVLEARKKVLAFLTKFSARSWLTFEMIEDVVRKYDYEFLLERVISSFFSFITDKTPYSYYNNSLGWNFYERVNQGEYDQAYPIEDETQGWDLVEAGFIAAMIVEPLGWMGLVDLGFEQAQDSGEDPIDSVISMRFSELGAHLLLGTELNDPQLQVQGRLIVQPTFHVLLYPPISEDRLALLDRVADRLRLEQVAEYRLTRDSLYRARQQHELTSEAVVAILEEASGMPLPQNVAYTLLEWGQAQNRIRLHEGLTLFRVAQPKQLDQLLATPSTAGLIERRLSETAALVARADQAALEQALLAAGQLALVYQSPNDLQIGGDWIEIDESGLILLKTQAPSIYLRSALRRFCLESEAGLLLNEALVRQAFADGLGLDDLLAQLRLWCKEPLPKPIEGLLSKWAGLYGEARVARPTLLLLENQQMAERLLHDPELAGLIKPYRPAEVTLEIDPARLDELKQLLEARFLSLSDSDQRK
jgi:hypothetical protein